MPQVIVVGGGFGGVRAAERLSRADVGGDVQVTLIDRTNHHAFAPLLYQVATAGLSPQDVAHTLRAMNARRTNVRVRQGVVESIELDARQIRLRGGVRLEYDHLVLAPGAVTAGVRTFVAIGLLRLATRPPCRADAEAQLSMC